MSETTVSTFFEPTFTPADDATRELVLSFAHDLGLSLTSAKKEKVIVILSSLLWACERMRRDGATDNLIGWSNDDKHWVEFPAVGKRVVREVREALIDKGLLTLFSEAKFKKTMTVYEISEDVFINKGNWMQSEKPTVTVKSEKATIYITGDSVGGGKITPAKARKKFGSKLDSARSRVQRLKEFWHEHPLVIDGNKYVSATRVFNDGRLDRGGRLYGGWVTLPEATRLTGTIDGHPVAEIDLRAANLTLLTGMTGDAMPDTPFGDPYAFVAADRDKVKRVVLEVLGSGNANKRRGSKEYNDTFGKGQFVPVRDKLTETFPALKNLKPGVLDSNALAFRESEIVLSTIEVLMAKGIPSYPMHDALICKASDSDVAAEVLQNVFEEDCGIRPALKIQGLGGEKEILGCYTSGG
ncbi:hypothetical protein C1J05_10040 [Sulfitobacter sp. JL08]|uniref:hypothetical protein n=1 Tax=Sulfitobacter sp. JL08 TaxID=2070369 RepID=UPI000E0A9826|nr:hypothetical protein [Sulfitobacter sp. JL08]AXI54793.1 hypothetical protein C1J05_10040 [Sulfitobacter sp. JL08]